MDITNFVLLEVGQPMHAFDLSHVAGKQIIVRRAKAGEKIVTLDEKEFTLTPENLVICDAEKPVALAGIMGGLNSEIEAETRGVLFECAKFERAKRAPHFACARAEERFLRALRKGCGFVHDGHCDQPCAAPRAGAWLRQDRARPL